MSLFNELKRRNVFRVGIAYVVIAWLLAQVADLAFENFGTPDWAIKTLLFVLVMGFPLALFFAWAFELTPEGIKKEKEVDRTQSITHHTGRKLDYTIIAILVVALAYFAFDKFVLDERQDSELVADNAAAVEAEATAEPDRSIAVLPFADMSPDKDQEYFSDGISEEILNSLARVKELKVAGRTSSFSFKGKDDDLRTIGAALGVAHILEGSIRKAGNTLRITAQLIKVDDGFHLWSDTYDRELVDVFAIQDEIAAAILEQMKLHLIGGESEIQLASARADVEAYNLYLAAKQNIYKRTRSALELAANLLDRAITIDPGYAPSYAQRGIVTILLSEDNYGDTPEDDVYAQAKPLLEKSIELDPGLAEGLAGLGLYYEDQEESEKAIELLERALEINPNLINARNWLQNALSRTGQIAASVAMTEQILERDPLYRPAISNAGWGYIRTGELEKLKALIERVNLYMPGDTMLLRIESIYERETGNYARSMKLAEALWQDAVEKGESVQNNTFIYSLSLAKIDHWERLLEIGLPGFKFWALINLGRVEEATLVANQRVLEDEDYSSVMNLFLMQRKYQQLIDLVESQWQNLDDFEKDEPQRDGFGAEDLLDIAYAYEKVGNQEKFNEVLARAQEAHTQQISNGANNAVLSYALGYQALLERDEEKALAHLERALEQGNWNAGRDSKYNEAFAVLDGVPRYESILTAMLAHVNGERAKLDLEPLEPEPFL